MEACVEENKPCVCIGDWKFKEFSNHLCVILLLIVFNYIDHMLSEELRHDCVVDD
jgi:ribosome-associated toxin RatA of RatAB toxin-antitoxin module